MNYRRKSNILAVVVVILIVALIVGALAALSSGFTNWDVKTWFGGEESVKTEDNENTVTSPVIDDQGTPMLGGVVNNMPTRMLFSHSVATMSADSSGYTSVTIQATVLPETVVNKEVDWSVSWANKDSAWATSKTVTDYVTVTPQNDGSTTATVKCLKDFGEQIIVTVTSRDNVNTKAQCTVDFYQRINDISLSFSDEYATYSSNTLISDFDSTGNNTLYFTGNNKNVDTVTSYSSYTVSDTFDYTYKLTWNSNYLLQLGNHSIRYLSGVNDEGQPIDEATEPKVITELSTGLFFGYQTEIASGYTVLNIMIDGTTLNNYVEAIRAHGDSPIATLSITATGAHSTFEKEISLKYDLDTLKLSAASIVLDKDTIII